MNWRQSGLLVVLAILPCFGAEPTRRLLGEEDRKLVNQAVDRLRSSARTPEDQRLVEEIEQRCNVMFFLCGRARESREALAKLKAKGSAFSIAAALRHPELARRHAAAHALDGLRDPSFVPVILESLRAGNYAAEGSEEPAVHRDYKKQLVALLSGLTGEKYEVADYDDEKQIQEVVRRVEQWIARHKTPEAKQPTTRPGQTVPR